MGISHHKLKSVARRIGDLLRGPFKQPPNLKTRDFPLTSFPQFDPLPPELQMIIFNYTFFTIPGIRDYPANCLTSTQQCILVSEEPTFPFVQTENILPTVALKSHRKLASDNAATIQVIKVLLKTNIKSRMAVWEGYRDILIDTIRGGGGLAGIMSLNSPCSIPSTVKAVQASEGAFVTGLDMCDFRARYVRLQLKQLEV